MIVADASALIAFFLRMQGADEIRARLFDSGLALQVPYLIDIEVAQVIRRHAAAGKIGPGQGGELLADFADLPLRRHPHDWLLPRVWELRHNLTA